MSWITKGKDGPAKFGKRYDAHRQWENKPKRIDFDNGEIDFDGGERFWISSTQVEWLIGRQLEPGECVEVVSSEVMG